MDTTMNLRFKELNNTEPDHTCKMFPISPLETRVYWDNSFFINTVYGLHHDQSATFTSTIDFVIHILVF